MNKRLLQVTVFNELKLPANDWPDGKRNFIMNIKAQRSILRIAMDTVESIHKI